MSEIRHISNPFIHSEGYHCFGCSPHNPIGLHLSFYDEGDFVCATWTPQKEYEGFKNVLHGGIQTTLLDEIASWTVYTRLKSAGVTSNINIRFRKPVLISQGPITLKSKLIEMTRNFATMETKLFNSEGMVCCEAEIKYFIYPEEKARTQLMYPGIESFYRQPEP